MNVAAAFEKIKASNPAEAGVIEKYIQEMKSKDVVALATDEAFALRDSHGEIRAFKQRVRLSAAEGTLVQPVNNGPFVISAMGYTKLAEASGAIVMNAPTVLVEGKAEQNPYVYRDKNNGRILAIYCRAIAFRYSSKGIPQVSDRTTIFDVPAYRMIDLLGKAKNLPQAFALLPRELGPEVLDQEVEIGVEGKGRNARPKTGAARWGSYPLDESFSLWVNGAHEEALKFYAQIINREKKAMEFAQTFAQRNAVKHLLGLQMPPGQVHTKKVDIPERGDKPAYSFTKIEYTPIDTWDVPVICWRPVNGNIIKWDGTKYAQIVDTMAAVAGGQGDVILDGQTPHAALPEAPKGIQVTHGVDRVSEEAEAIEEMVEPEDRAAEAEFGGEEAQAIDMEPSANGHTYTHEQPEEPPVSSAPSVSEILSKQLAAAAQAMPEDYEQAKINLRTAGKMSPAGPANDTEAKALMAEINRLADSAE